MHYCYTLPLVGRVTKFYDTAGYELGFFRILFASTGCLVTENAHYKQVTYFIALHNSSIMAVFGHVRRLPEEAPGRLALWLAVDTRIGCRPESNPCWKRRPGRPRHAWVRQVESDT